MWVSQVSARNFRAFGEVSWKLPQTGLVFVAGANNAGKSSLLAALDVVAGREEGSAQSRRHAQSQSPTTVTATLELDETERHSLIPLITDGFELVNAGAFSFIELVFSEYPDGQFLLGEIRSIWPNGEMVTLGKTEIVEPGKYSTAFIAEEVQSMARAPILSVRMAPSSQPIPPESAGSLSPLVRQLFVLYSQWRSRYYHFRALRPGTQRSMNLSSEANLDPSGSNLPAVLLDLQTNRPHLLETLRQLVSEIVPDAGRLETPTSGSQVEVAFADPYAPQFRHNLKEIGTGVEQLLLTLVVGLTQAVPCTLVMEEPETNLHPAAQRAMLGLLRSWSSNRLIIVATHSPVMLDGADSNLWHVTREHGLSVARQIDSSPIEVYRSLGVRLSDVLSADRILVVEGPSDESVLAEWFPGPVRNPRVAIIPGGGGDNARHANLLAEWIQKADSLDRRRVLFLRDRDELSAGELEKITKGEAVRVLDRRELENYLLDADAIIGALATYGKDSLPESDAVNSAIIEAAHSLKRSMVINRVARQLEPIRLMDHKTRGRLVKAGVDATGIKQHVSGRINDGSAVLQKIDDWWQSAEAEIESLSDTELVRLAPGADILDAVYMRFKGRHFQKNADAVLIARAMSRAPDDLQRIIEEFLSESSGT